jgi:hypothetical protein
MESIDIDEELDRLQNQAKVIKNYPVYLGVGIGFVFALFITSALFSFLWLVMPSIRFHDINLVLAGIFVTALTAFFIVCIIGLSDISDAMESNFEKLKREKDEIKSAPEGATFSAQLASLLVSNNLPFETEARILSDGKQFVADFVLPTAKKPQFIIEVKAIVDLSSILDIASRFNEFHQVGINTILISRFENKKLRSLAEGFGLNPYNIKELDKAIMFLKTKLQIDRKLGA